MGWTWEVEAYRKWNGKAWYEWDVAWEGQSFAKALLAMRKEKKTAGAVRLTWR